jgi:membrane associated rhomboid family serine protease
MIPLRDTTRAKTVPYVNYTIIAICGAAFLYELSLGEAVNRFIFSYGVVPVHLASAFASSSIVVGPFLSVLTSLFLHGGWLHLLGNMLYLYIFGDNVEDRVGHGGYLVFYVLCGIGATATQVWSAPRSDIPLIGASGAIAGVLGAYFLLYPRARILTLIPLFVFFPVVEVSAFFFLGFWLLIQFLQGSLSAGSGGGVAWWAHAGGFVAGAVLLPLFLLMRRLFR